MPHIYVRDLNAGGQMTLGETRIVDAVLTTIAQGYMHLPHLYKHLFRTVPVMRRSGKVVQFGTESFLERDGLERAPGSLIQQVQYGYTAQTYALVNRALEGIVPDELREEAAAPGSPGIDMAASAVRMTMETMELQIELAAAKLATKLSNYADKNKKTLSGDDQWTSTSSNMLLMVEKAKEQIAGGIGQKPNFMGMGPVVWSGLRTNDTLRKEIYATQKVASIGIEELKRYFDIENIMVGEARYKKTPNGLFIPAWGNNVILAYNNTASIANLGAPSYGYCYELNGYPYAGPGRRIEDRNAWGYKIVTENTPVIAAKSAAYLFTDVVDLAIAEAV